MGWMDLTSGIGRERDLEGLFPSQAMVFLVPSLGRKDVCILLNQAN